MRKLLLLLLVVSRSAYAGVGLKIEGLDFLGPEVVGELQPRTYDLSLGGKYSGPISVQSPPLVTGGFGIRLVVREPSGRSNSGVRFSYEASGQWGRFNDGPYSTVSRYELLGGVGYEGTLGILVLHTATIVGLDYQAFDLGKDASVNMVSLRAGQQVGARLQVSDWVALYADGTIDWDGQWRVRAGFSISRLFKQSSPASRGVFAPR
jgi:hypothetical protein